MNTWTGLLIALSLLLIVLFLYFIAPDLFQLVEVQMLDWRMRLRDFKTPPEQVKLITIDRASFEHYGLDETMRSSLADILDDICGKGAMAIGLDLFFVSSDQPVIDPSRQKLVKAMQKCGNVVIGYRWKLDYTKTRLAKGEAIGRRQLLEATRAQDEKGFIPENLPAIVEIPDPLVIHFAKAVGYFTIVTDPDKKVRRLPSTMTFNDVRYYPFSLALVRTYLKQGEYGVTKEGRLTKLIGPHIEGVNLMPDPSGYLWLSYYGPRGIFPSIRFEDAVKNKVPENFAKGSIILFGVSGYDSGDLFSTPYDPFLPGVAIHATAVANALASGFLWRDYLTRIIEIVCMAVCALLMGILMPKIHPLSAVFIGPILGICIWSFAQRLLISYSMWMQLICPFLLIFIVYLVELAVRIIQAEKALSLAMKRKKAAPKNEQNSQPN